MMKPIYDTSTIKCVNGVDLSSTDDAALCKSVAVSIQNNQEVQPAAFHVNVRKNTKLFMSALIIQKIYDNATWELWEAGQ